MSTQVPKTTSEPPSSEPPTTEPSTFLARNGFRLSAVVLLIIGIIPLVARGRLKFGTLAKPGPAMWPTVTAVLLLVCAIGLLVLDRREDYEQWTRRSLVAVAAAFSLVLFVGLFLSVGFMIAAMVMLIIWLRFFGGEPWKWALILGIVGGLVAWLVFGFALSVPFPAPLILGGEQ